MNLQFASVRYRVIRDRIRELHPSINEQTLAAPVEGLTDLHENVGAALCSALTDEALARGLKGRIAEMKDRFNCYPTWAAGAQGRRRSRCARDLVGPGPPRLERRDLVQDLRNAKEMAGAALSIPEPILTLGAE